MKIEITVRIDAAQLSEPSMKSAKSATVEADDQSSDSNPTVFPSSRLMRLHEVMTYLKATRSEIDAFVSSGRLPRPIRRGRGLLFPSDAVQLLMMNLRAAELRRSSE